MVALRNLPPPGGRPQSPAVEYLLVSPAFAEWVSRAWKNHDVTAAENLPGMARRRWTSPLWSRILVRARLSPNYIETEMVLTVELSRSGARDSTEFGEFVVSRDSIPVFLAGDELANVRVAIRIAALIVPILYSPRSNSRRIDVPGDCDANQFCPHIQIPSFPAAAGNLKGHLGLVAGGSLVLVHALSCGSNGNLARLTPIARPLATCLRYGRCKRQSGPTHCVVKR